MRRNAPLLVTFSLLIMLLVVTCWNNIFVTLHSGEAGVLFSRFFGGTIVDHPYGEGLHLIFPWNKMYVYDIRHRTVDHNLTVLSKHGLPIDIEMTIRFRPEYNFIGFLHDEVGPDYEKKIVIPEVESALRSTIGHYSAEEVYTTKRAVVQKVVNQSLEKIAEHFVQVDDVMITKVTLPEAIQAAIEQKLVEEQKLRTYEFLLATAKREAERKRIEAEGIDSYQRIVASSLNDRLLTEKGIRATESLARSPNSKLVVVGGGKLGLPLILGGETANITNSETEAQNALAKAPPEPAAGPQIPTPRSDTIVQDTSDAADDAGDRAAADNPVTDSSDTDSPAAAAPEPQAPKPSVKETPPSDPASKETVKPTSSSSVVVGTNPSVTVTTERGPSGTMTTIRDSSSASSNGKKKK